MNHIMEFDTWVVAQSIKKFLDNYPKSKEKPVTINSVTGEVDLKYDPEKVEEDYFIPQRKLKAQWKNTGIYLDTSTVLKSTACCPNMV